MNPFQQLIDLSENPQRLSRYHSLGGNKPQEDSLSTQILTLLKDKEGMLLSEIVKEIEANPGSVKSALKRLLARGDICNNRFKKGCTPAWYFIPGTNPNPPTVVTNSTNHPLIQLLRERKTITQAEYCEITGTKRPTAKDIFSRFVGRKVIKAVKKNPSGFVYALEMGV